MEQIQIGKILKNLVNQKKVDLKQVSIETGIPYSTLHAWTENRPPKNLIQLKKLSEYFNISIDKLIFNQEDSNFNNLFTGKFEIHIKKINEKF